MPDIVDIRLLDFGQNASLLPLPIDEEVYLVQSHHDSTKDIELYEIYSLGDLHLCQRLPGKWMTKECMINMEMLLNVADRRVNLHGLQIRAVAQVRISNVCMSNSQSQPSDQFYTHLFACRKIAHTKPHCAAPLRLTERCDSCLDTIYFPYTIFNSCSILGALLTRTKESD